MTLDKMPTSIVDERKRQEVDKTIRGAVKKLQSSLLRLNQEPDVQTPASACLEEWQAAMQAVNERREKASEHIMTDMSLADSERAQRLSAWAGWHKRITSYITTIIRILSEFSAGWEWDETLQTITPTIDITKVAEEVATVPVPQEAREHVALIVIAQQAVEGLRAWEREHGCVKLHLEQLFSLSEEELAQRWATGAIQRPVIDAPFSGLINTGREMAESQYV